MALYPGTTPSSTSAASRERNLSAVAVFDLEAPFLAEINAD
jgi:hypothetical protein